MTQTAKKAVAEADVELWDCNEDCETLRYDNITEAVECWADDIHPDPLPEMVTVYGFNHLSLPSVERLAGDILESVVESLDGDYGSDEEATEHTPAMKAAALAFATVMRAEYTVWRCEQVAKEDVRVADHVPAEWLTPAEAKP